MRRFVALFTVIILTLLCYASLVSAQALTLGTVTLKGDAKVTGPGGTYTGQDVEAPLLPGSSIDASTGQAILNVTGKGSIIVNKGGSIKKIDEKGLPFLEKGSFQVKIPANSHWNVDTPRGIVKIKAGKEMGIFSISVKTDRVEVITGRVCVAVAKSENLVYEYDKGKKKYILRGKTYAAGPKAKLLRTDSAKLLAGFVPCCYVAGLEGGEAESVKEGTKGIIFLDESNVKGNVLSLLEKGSYKIKVPPEARWNLNTPRGVVRIKSGKETGIFTVIIKDDRVVVITGKNSLIEASGDNLIYKYDEATKRYILKGKKYASLPQVNLLLTDSRKLLGGYIPCCYAALAAPTNTGTIIAAGSAAVAIASIIAIAASNNNEEHHHHKASPSSP